MEDIEQYLDFHHHNNYFDNIDTYDREFLNFNGILILQVNARSINKMDRFDNLKIQISKLIFKPQIVVVSETWIPSHLTQLYNIDGYDSFFSCRKDARGGGLAVFVSKNLTFSVTANQEIFSNSNSFHFLQVTISSSSNKSLIVSAYYRPPDDHIFSEFMQHLNSILDSGDSPHVVVGDINIDSNSSSRKLDNYLNVISSYGFAITNTNITRPSSSSIIDHVLFNYQANFSLINDTIFNSDSDHNFILSSINFTPNKNQTDNHYKLKTNFTKLQQLLEMRFSPAYMGNFDNPNDFYNYFTNTLTKSISDSTTKHLINNKKSSICPWINENLQSLFNSSRNLRKKKNKLLSQGKNIEHIETKIKSLSEKINNYSSILQQNYYKEKFSKSKSTKDIWNNINEVLGRKHKDKIPNNMTKVSDSGVKVVIDNKQTIANEFNNFFTSIGQSLACKIPKTTNDDINKFNTLKTCPRSFNLEPTNENEIITLIDSLNNNTSCGHDKISAFILKKVKLIVAPVLTNIFNLCMVNGYYPDQLKIAKVSPIFKSGSNSLFSNYRPISVLSLVNKIFEKILYQRLNHFLTSMKFFCTQQYGFRQKSSTTNAVIDLVNKIQRHLDDREDVLGLFLDLSKAFDTVDHNILLAKLERAGVRGVPLDLFKSYLSNRSQFVSFDGIESNINSINIGVPQGSVLGPLFFIIYLNDLAFLSLKGKLKLFADDSSFLYNNKFASVNDKNLHDDLKTLIEYFRINKLTLNISKSNIINIKNSNRSTPNNLTITKNSFPEVKVVDESKYLGIFIDNRLNWSTHINSLLLKLNQITGIIYKIRHKLSLHVLLLIYHSLFNSHLSYITAVWGNACNALVNKIQIAQNKFLRTIFNLPARSHSVDLYTKFKNIYPVRGLYIIQSCCFIFSCLSNQTHSNTIFEPSTHEHDTRNHDSLQRPNISTLAGERSISFKGAQLYNIFTNKFGNCTSLSIFKKQLTSFLSQPDIINILLKSYDIPVQ